MQRRPNVFDVGPTLYKAIQFFCVLWDEILSGVSSGLLFDVTDRNNTPGRQLRPHHCQRSLGASQRDIFRLVTLLVRE